MSKTLKPPSSDRQSAVPDRDHPIQLLLSDGARRDKEGHVISLRLEKFVQHRGPCGIRNHD